MCTISSAVDIYEKKWEPSQLAEEARHRARSLSRSVVSASLSASFPASVATFASISAFFPLSLDLPATVRGSKIIINLKMADGRLPACEPAGGWVYYRFSTCCSGVLRLYERALPWFSWPFYECVPSLVSSDTILNPLMEQFRGGDSGKEEDISKGVSDSLSSMPGEDMESGVRLIYKLTFPPSPLMLCLPFPLTF